MRAKKTVLTILVGLGLATGALADTLRLRSGQSLQGSLVSASTREIRFMGSDGQVRAFAIGQVESVAFAAPPPPPAPVAAPAPTAVPANVTVPAGTLILIRMVDSLDTSKTKTGDRFTATLDTNLAASGIVVARKGTTVHGRVKKSENARRLTGKSELQLELTDIVIGGTAHPILTSDFQSKGKSEGAQTLKKTAGGAGLGAAIGAIGGDAGKGAAIGATAGLGLAMTKKGEPIRIPSETLLEFKLQQPAPLPVAR